MTPSSLLSCPERFYGKKTAGLNCQRCPGTAVSIISTSIRGTGAAT
jgi:hypothetical protein